MKKVLVAILCLFTVSAFAQTADDVIMKYTANMGGLDAFNRVTTAKITGTFTAQGNDFPLTTQIINGKAMRTDIDIMGQTVTNAYISGKGWKVNGFAGIPNPTEVSGTELNDFKNQVYLATALMDYKARGHQVEMQGEETVGGVKTYKIKLTAKEDARVTTFYISTADYTMIKTVTSRNIQGKDVDVETWFSDLKDINGLKFFMHRESKLDGETFQSIQFEKVELNVPIEEKIFDMPK